MNTKLTTAAHTLQQWRTQHQLTDDETRAILLATWPHIVRGIQQREAGKSTSERKAAAARANGAKGGRPKQQKETP